jgi:hypothetical protein
MTPSEQPKVPKCPFCEVQPCPTAMQLVSYGMGAFAAIFVCASCEKILSVAPLPQLDVADQPKPLVIPPGRVV